MIQKIIKVGNSVAVTIPQSFIKTTGYKVGDAIEVEQDEQHKMLLLRPVTDNSHSRLTPEFFEWLDNITATYGDVIKELANK